MFYAAALVPYVSVGKPITKVTYKHTPRKHLCLLELTIECALYCRQSEEAFIKQARSISPKQTLPVPGKRGAGVSGNFVTNLPKLRAGSTGRCNTGLQFTRRSFKAQGFSRALIEAQSYLVEIGLRVDGQVGLLGEVLS
jgi:hypothetical protein